MTAGRGIVHSEMPEQEDGLMWGTQLWVNLPASEKMTEPLYQEFDAGRLPKEKRADGINVTVIAGTTTQDTAGAVTGRPTDPIYFDVQIPEGARFDEPLAETHSGFIFVVEGAISVAADSHDEAVTVDSGNLAILGDGNAVSISGRGTNNRILLIAGRAINEPIARGGPFVMNTEEEIRQAFSDYQSGNF